MEALLFAAVLAVGLLPMVAVVCRARSRILVADTLVLCVAVPVAMAWTASKKERLHRRLVSEQRPVEIDDSEYVSSRTCRACHPDNYATWHASYHRTMTQFASPEAVGGNFDDVQLALYGRTYHLQRRGDEFWVTDRRGSQGPRDRRIVMTTGSHHYQLYWAPFGNGRLLWPLPFAFLIDEQRWIPRRAAFLGPVDKTAVIMGNWNRDCIQCHATRGRARIDEQDNVDTHVGEFGIACEACHGPGAQHVRGNRDPRRRYQYHLSREPDPTIVNPERLSSRLSSQVCGQCHGISWFYSDEAALDWYDHGFWYRPGDELTKTRLIHGHRNREHPRMRELLAEEPTFLESRFWSDGMVRVSGREYNGLLETPCHQHGELSCLSCHSMHKSADDSRSLKEWANDQLKPGMEGDVACLQCHEAYRANIQDHTHHHPDSSGSRCYNCHMPHTTYGLLKAIRSHQIDTPSVANSLETGRPNACNLCHLDRTLGWAAKHLSEWYGAPLPELREDEQTIAASLLWLLRGDAGQRALIAWSMGWETARKVSRPGWMAPFLAQLLDDPYEAVRFIAQRSLRRLPGFADFKYDFVGPHPQRVAQIQRALEIWSRTGGGADRPTGEAILTDSRVVPRWGVVDLLLKQRNDRPLELHE